MMPIFHLSNHAYQVSNQQNQQTWSHLLSHNGPPSTEIPTTETTTARGAIKTVEFI